MKQSIIGIVFVLAGLAFGCGGRAATPSQGTAAPVTASSGGEPASAPEGSLLVANDSSYSIHYLYMSSTSDSSWGPDRLGNATIPPGSTFTLEGVPCDDYDVKIVDEDGDECQMQGRLCSDSALHITNDRLLACEGF